MLELCWADQPNARPNIEDVLQYLEGASQSWEPPSSEINRTMGDGGDQDTESYSFGMFSRSTPPQHCAVSVHSFVYSCHFLSPYTAGNDPSDYSGPSDNQSFLSTNSGMLAILPLDLSSLHVLGSESLRPDSPNWKTALLPVGKPSSLPRNYCPLVP